MSNLEIDTNGDQFWKDDQGKLHRDDNLPAIIVNNNDKSQFWYFHGKSHRAFGPSSEWSDGEIYWRWLGIRIKDE